MANYCSTDDVRVLLSMVDDFSATSKPTSTQVTQIITNITNEIDVYLRRAGITSQPTDTNVLGLLKKYCSYGSACIVAMSTKLNNDSVTNSQASYYCKSYHDFLKSILENPELLADAAGAESIYVSNQVLDGTVTEEHINNEMIPNDFEV